MLSCYDRIGLPDIHKSFPTCGTMLSLDAELPSLEALSHVSSVIDDDTAAISALNCMFIRLMINNASQLPSMLH